MDYSNMGSRSSERWDWRKSKVIKEWGTGRILETNDLMAGPMIHLIRISEVKLVTVAKGNPKAPFSIATTPRCKGGRYSFSWIAPLYP